MSQGDEGNALTRTERRWHLPFGRLAGQVATTVATLGALIAAAGLPAQAVSVQHTTMVLENPADWTPHAVNGTVYKLATIGNRAYYGGSFTQVRNSDSATIIYRSYLIAVDLTTRHIDTGFNPVLNGTVRALLPAPDGQSIYVGGDFTTVNGTTTQRLARLNAATGVKWAGFAPPSLSSAVDDMKLLGQRLIIGGRFQTVGGVSRKGLTALNATTGAADGLLNNVPLSVPRVTATGSTAPVKVTGMDITPDGGKLVIIGNFNQVAGQNRQQIAVIDLTTNPATLSGWYTSRYEVTCSNNYPTYMRGIDIAADGSWFAVVTTGAMRTGALCDAAVRFEFGTATSGKQPTWVNYTGGDTLLSVAVTGNAVYVGGHQRWLDNPFGKDSAGAGAVSREGIGAIHPVTGKALAWNPGKTRGVGTEDLLPTTTGLWIGSDQNTVNGEYHGKVAFFPLP
jgi:hypothetical protein